MTVESQLRFPDLPSRRPADVLRRRQFLQGALLLGLGGLTGCTRAASPTLMAAPETLPLLWRRTLPKPWRFTPLRSASQLDTGLPEQADLLALPDGWIPAVPEDAWQPLQADRLRQHLSSEAVAFLETFTPARSSALLPLSLSPWVLLFRGADHVQAARDQGWQALLDPGLAGQLVLPASPRLLVSLAARMEGADSLRRLRRAAKVFDDRHALNWLLQGKAKAAVLPLARCMATLRSDPRVSAVLPEQGAPLNWTLLMRPAASREPLPQAWVEKAWSSPLLGRLLAEGWVPPLPRRALEPMQTQVPERLRSLVLPPSRVMERCWNLPPLSPSDRIRLRDQWEQSAP